VLESLGGRLLRMHDDAILGGIRRECDLSDAEWQAQAARREIHLGGPDDDHYAKLGRFQPIRVTELWSRFWPVGIHYHLGESIAAIARCGLKGNPVYHLRKAAWLLSRAADELEGKNDLDGGPKWIEPVGFVSSKP
jgi:hypothetical protein